eukprot:5799978-Prymnesium_polylepis.2
MAPGVLAARCACSPHDCACLLRRSQVLAARRGVGVSARRRAHRHVAEHLEEAGESAAPQVVGDQEDGAAPPAVVGSGPRVGGRRQTFARELLELARPHAVGAVADREDAVRVVAVEAAGLHDLVERAAQLAARVILAHVEVLDRGDQTRAVLERYQVEDRDHGEHGDAEHLRGRAGATPREEAGRPSRTEVWTTEQRGQRTWHTCEREQRGQRTWHTCERAARVCELTTPLYPWKSSTSATIGQSGETIQTGISSAWSRKPPSHVPATGMVREAWVRPPEPIAIPCVRAGRRCSSGEDPTQGVQQPGTEAIAGSTFARGLFQGVHVPTISESGFGTDPKSQFRELD